MNSRKNSKYFLSLVGLLLALCPLFADSAFRSYGNEHLELTGGPGGSVFGQLWGLYHAGSDNVRYNSMALESDKEHHLFLFHSLLYDQLVTTTTGAYAFPLFKDKLASVMLSRVTVDHIPDTRSALLDWGKDGIPGTHDEGEGNNQLDAGEWLDYDQVSYHSSGITTISMGTPLGNFSDFQTAITINAIMMKLIAENGFGLTFDFHFYKKGERFHSLYALNKLPLGVTAYTDGSVELYSPYIESAWTMPLSFGPFLLNPGLTMRYLPGYERHEGVNIGSFGNLMVRPGVMMDFKSLISLGTSYDSRQRFSLFTAVSLNFLTVEYAFRMNSHTLLGNSHLVAISFDPSFLLED